MELVIVPVAIALAFYFILLRPVIQQQKRRRSELTSLSVGDEVLTTGGFYAIVDEIETTESGRVDLWLELAPDVIVRASTDSIQVVTLRASDLPADEAEADEQAADDRPDDELPADPVHARGEGEAG
jgi:preprotein translocase subunit YajC